MMRAPPPVDLAAVSHPGIDLWWIPLGAGGHFVRINGMIYERLRSWREGRAPLDLYHTALVVTVPEGRFVIEDAWPIPDERGASRGAVVEGPVFSRAFAGWRSLRYEVRVWRDGTIFDAGWAVESPQWIAREQHVARRALALARQVPARVWGRDEAGVGDMWNSNSVVSWILATAGLHMDRIRPPPGGAAPGWLAGISLARPIAARSVEHPSVATS